MHHADACNETLCVKRSRRSKNLHKKVLCIVVNIINICPDDTFVCVCVCVCVQVTLAFCYYSVVQYFAYEKLDLWFHYTRRDPCLCVTQILQLQHA